MSALAYATENNYDMLSQFESVKEFNNHFEQSMLLYKKYFSKGEYIALNNLRHFAGSDIPGIAWVRIIKAVSSTFKDTEFGVSRRTYERMLVKAKEINLITVRNQERNNGSQKHNLFIFNRLEELIEPPIKNTEVVSKSHTIDVPKPLKIDAPISIILYLPKIKNIKNTYQQADAAVQNDNILDFVKEKRPRDQLQDLVANLFNDKTIANRMYGSWVGQTSKLINEPSFDLAKQATMILINEVRRRYDNGIKPLDNPVGYFNNTLANLINDWVEGELDHFKKNREYDHVEDLAAKMDLTITHNWLDEQPKPIDFGIAYRNSLKNKGH